MIRPIEKVVITDGEKKKFAGIYLLDYMVEFEKTFPVLLEGNNDSLEPILEGLLVDEYVSIENKESYNVTALGKEAAHQFAGRYREFLKFYDVFCAVDLEQGVFAFEQYFQHDSQEAWEKYLHQDNWSDMRIAVARFKKINPVEIVFMSYLNEDRFGRNNEGWQFDLLLGSIWDEIADVVNSAISWEDLGYEDEESVVEANVIMEDIVTQGASLMLELVKREGANKKEEYAAESSRSQSHRDSEGLEIVEYFDDYIDPYYVSPYWR